MVDSIEHGLREGLRAAAANIELEREVKRLRAALAVIAHEAEALEVEVTMDPRASQYFSRVRAILRITNRALGTDYE